MAGRRLKSRYLIECEGLVQTKMSVKKRKELWTMYFCVREKTSFHRGSARIKADQEQKIRRVEAPGQALPAVFQPVWSYPCESA
jgi:hypothetical protein